MGIYKKGQFSGVDLALVSIDDDKLPVSLRLRRISICQGEPRPGQSVTVAIPASVAPSHVIAPTLLPHNLAAKYRTAISDVETTGNSGSGVFDSLKECLLGIISAKISGAQVSGYRADQGLKPIQRDIVKYWFRRRRLQPFCRHRDLRPPNPAIKRRGACWRLRPTAILSPPLPGGFLTSPTWARISITSGMELGAQASQALMPR